MSPASSHRVAFVAFALALSVPAHASRAQKVFDARGAVHMRDQYMADLDTLHAKFVALAMAIPEDEYTWRPAPGVRSVSETLMHVAHEWYYYVPESVGGIAPANFGPPKAAETRLGLVTKKGEVLDLHEHLGQLIAYARANGVKPPWTK